MLSNYMNKEFNFIKPNKPLAKAEEIINFENSDIL